MTTEEQFSIKVKIPTFIIFTPTILNLIEEALKLQIKTSLPNFLKSSREEYEKTINYLGFLIFQEILSHVKYPIEIHENKRK